MTDDRTQIIGRGSTVEIGTELNQTYRIDSLIGVGGMGEVFKGHNIQTGDPVAIKVVLPEFARDEMIFELFRKEARVLNHLSHDAIVRYYVFSLDRALGRPYLAMEFVDGPSLAERLKSKPLSVPDFFSLLRLLADGLHKAHEAGVIHRDISPDNVILPGGLVENAKIIDFGIARSASVGGGTLLGGSFAGKYSYVSPEQLGLYGGEVTPKSDIYSLALTMAAAVRGQPIDMSGSQVEVIEKRRKVPDLAAAGILPELRAILTSMLQPDPANRFASMAEVRDRIDKEQAARAAKSKATKPPQAKSNKPGAGQSVASNQAPNAGATKSGKLRNTAVALGLVAVIGVGILGGWIYVQNQRQAASETPAQAATQQLPSDANQNAASTADAGALKTEQQATADKPAVQQPATQVATAEPQPDAVAPPVVPAPSPTAVEVAKINPAPEPSPPTPSPVVASPPKKVEAVPTPTLPKPSPAVKPPAKMDMAALTRFVSSFGATGCLKTDIISLSETSAKLAATGTDASRSDFQRDFTLKAGFTPEITFKPVMPEQCEFVSALGKLPPRPAMPLRLTLDRTEIRANQPGQSATGDALNVTVSGIGDRNAYLYVVDYAGGIQNISRACPNCIKMKSGDMLASLSLSPPDNSDGAVPKDLPMIIFAVAASKPLLSLNDQDAYESNAFVTPLLKAVAADGFAAQSAYVTLKGN